MQLEKTVSRIFIHGLESNNQGTKSVFFREKYPDMIIPTFVGTLPDRLSQLNRHLAHKSNLQMVGSSFGGLMGALFAMENEDRVNRLILLAPAIHMIHLAPGTVRRISVPVHVYHGTEDRVIPFGEVEKAATQYFENLTFNKVMDDHFLHETFKTIRWDTLLA